MYLIEQHCVQLKLLYFDYIRKYSLNNQINNKMAILLLSN